MLKWILAFMLAAAMSVAMIGCGGPEPDRPQTAPAPEPGSPPPAEEPPTREPGS